MKVNYRLWIEDENNQRMMGEGVALLLEAIDRTGSINRAASELKMSYRNAWAKIEKTEHRLGYKLVARRIGGSEGGGSTLTKEGRTLLESFQKFHEAAGREIEQLFRHYFD